MIALKKANYLGRVDSFREENGIIASVTSYPDTGYAESLHYHDTLHMSFILRGGNLEKREQQDIDRLPGIVTFYDPGEPHRSTFTLPGSRHVNLEITNAFMEQYQVHSNAAELGKIRSPDARFLMLNVYKEMLLNDQDSGLSMEASVLRLLQLPPKPNKFKMQPAWVGRIEELLSDRWNEKLTLEDIAVAAQLHPVYISAYFPKMFGCTIGEYRRKIKIENSLSMTRDLSRSITTIAYECDFSDQSHFIRTFRQLTGLTPKAYRQLHC